MEKMKRFGFGVQFSNGIVFGIRHYEPDMEYNYYEIQLFVGFVVFSMTLHRD
tara:strand:- start:440 stop:595 length:156 start_codon:yes stop_codon:yes gene_type:complete